MIRVVFLLVPGVHLLDLAGPAQVFGTAAKLGLGYELRYEAETQEVLTAQGLPVLAGTQWLPLGPGDLLLIPGWRTGLGRYGPAVTQRLAATTARGAPRRGRHRGKRVRRG
jgi:hypothetical protein